MRCVRCGNENAEANRFCGMCGAPLVAKTPAAGESPGQAPAAAPAGPVITGPSFLGLNVPAAGGRTGDPQAGRDPLQPSSKNLDYLLEDEEEPRRGGGKVILVVAALALAVGFGYLHWKQGGFDWLKAGDKKPAAATKSTPDVAPAGADSGSSTAAAASPDGATPAGGASGVGTAPATSGTPHPAEPTPQATPSQTTSQTPAPQITPSQITPSQNAPSQNTASPQPTDPNLPVDAASPATSSDSDKPSAPAAPPARPKAETRKPVTAKPAAVRPGDAVTEAERYIYGRGVRPDCDRGLRLLKPAAEQSNPKAMISLGTLYSTGTCTPRDLPTAYRWFALALHQQPDNQALQDDLQKLWSRMTQPERQLAIKLSQ